ncbi:hypothetical protein D6C98_09267 [Aureobasidium pullulans]|nr:hypothetical protein D6C98_09267 [Aureobasidium pullulans]
MVKKRVLLWDYKNTRDISWAMDKINFKGSLCSVSNWNTWYPPELKRRLPFRPMIHGRSNLTGSEWNNILTTKEEVIHFFNEPERAGISPDEAARIWNDQVVLLRAKHGKRLVSPSCASDAAGISWINKWMSLVAKNPPDYLGLHWYGTKGDEMIKHLESMHKQHPNQKIIVSEWASTSRSYPDVLGLTVQLANWMDNTQWIAEYGLFGCMRQPADSFVSPAAQLMNADGTFTDLMWKYMSDQPMHT